MAILASDMFLRSEGQQLDFSKGVIDIADMFNSITPIMNKLLVDTGAEDPILESLQDNAYDAKRSKNQIPNVITTSNPRTPMFGFESSDVNTRQSTSTTSDAIDNDNEPLGARVVENHNSKDITSFVKTFEGFNSNAYADGRQTSIGFGTRAKKGESSISKQEAERRLASELSSHRNRVLGLSEKSGYDFSPAQIDALTSFDYNTGSLEKLTNNGKRSKEEIAAKILQYNKADLDGKGLKPLRGLTRRRKAESKLFRTGY